MIGYVTLGTNKIEQSAAFYDALLDLVGAKRFMEFETFVAWSTGEGTPGLSVTLPFDGQAATVGNGTMIALQLDSPEKVKAMHAKALELGGKDEGKPGARSGSFYAAYFRDLDGNKLNAYCITDGQ